MFRITAFQFFFNLWIGTLPEAVQVLGDLNRPLRRREQMQRYRHFAPRHARCVRQSEQLLKFYPEHRGFARDVFEPQM